MTPQFLQINSSTHAAFIYVLYMANILVDVCSTNFVASCTLIVPPSYTSISWQSISTGEKCFMHKNETTTSFLVRWSFYHRCHCTSTYTTNNSWLTDLIRLLHITPRTSATSYCKMKYTINMKGTCQQTPMSNDSPIVCVSSKANAYMR